MRHWLALLSCAAALAGCASSANMGTDGAGVGPDLSAAAAPDLAPCTGADCLCRSDADCGAGRRCDTDHHVCVECVADSDCPADRVCDLAAHRCTSGCSATRDACGDAGVCEADAGLCVECLVDDDCPDKALPRCDAAEHRCVLCQPTNDNCPAKTYCALAQKMWACTAGCKSDSDCPAMQHCDPAQHQCVACLVDGDCPAATLCKNGACVPGCNDQRPCPNGQVCCGGPSGVCSDVTSDPENCGGCGMACQPGWGCCNSACSNPVNNPLSCGACGVVCAVAHGTPACVMRACAVAACDAGWADCDGNYKDGCEVHTDVNVSNCGACGNACSLPHALPKCAGGQCQIDTCIPPWGDCNGNPADGCETAVDGNDPLNCGACGKVCMLANATAGCAKGVCTVANCNAGFGDCNHVAADGCETNVNGADVMNCGACGMTCGAVANGTAACAMGQCAVGSCNANFGDCDKQFANGCEADLTADPKNCGACGGVCPANAPVCRAGKCTALTQTMAWTDPVTGSCNGQIYQRMAQIASAMGIAPITVTITATQVSPMANYGNWSDTFPSTTCVQKWLAVWGNHDTNTYNNWDPAVCQATDMAGQAYFFVLKSDGANDPQVAIYPVGAQPGQYMKIYLLDRTFPWCDLAGTDNRPGFDIQTTNNDTSGVQGDSLSFTWY